MNLRPKLFDWFDQPPTDPRKNWHDRGRRGKRWLKRRGMGKKK